MSDIHNVAASGIGLSDRESPGHTSPTLRTNHHTHIETTLSHDCMGAASPDPVIGVEAVR
jgi:hypothetical protein